MTVTGWRTVLRAQGHGVAVAIVFAAACWLRFGGLYQELPYVHEFDAPLTTEPVAAGLKGNFFDIYARPERYSVYGALYPVAVWTVAVPAVLLKALTGRLQVDALASETAPIEFLTHDELVLLARLVSAFCGALTVLLVYGMGRALCDRRVALTAMLLFAVAPVAVMHGPMAKEIGLLLVLSNAALFCFVRYAVTGRASQFYWGCLIGGLAACTQQTGVLYAATVLGGAVIADGLQRRPFMGERWLVGILLVAAGVLLANPNLVVRSGPTLGRIAWLFGLLGRATTDIYGSGWHQLARILPELTGTVVFFAAAGGLGLALARRQFLVLLASAPALAVVGFAVSAPGQIVSYYLLPATPWLCLLAASAGHGLIDSRRWRDLTAALASRRAWPAVWVQRVAVAILLLVVVVPPARVSVAAVVRRSSATPAILAGQWLEQNLPSRVYVAADNGFPAMMLGRWRRDPPIRARKIPGTFNAVSEASLDWYRQQEVKFLGYSPILRDSMVLDLEKFKAHELFYLQLRTRWVRVFKAGLLEIFGDPLPRIEAGHMRVSPWKTETAPATLPAEIIRVSPPFRRHAAVPPFYNIPAAAFGNVPGDDVDAPTSKLVVYENGIPLGPGHGAWERTGYRDGVYGHWRGEGVYFTASDNTDPNTNGRQYAVSLADAGVILQPGMRLRYPWPLPAGSYRIVLRARLVTSQPATLTVAFDGLPPVTLTVSDPQWQDYSFPLTIAAAQGLVIDIVNSSKDIVWVDYMERVPQ